MAAKLQEGGEPDDGEPEEEEAVEPANEEIFFYRAPRTKKAVEMEVTKVDKKAKTVDLKSLDDGKKFLKVAWDDLKTDVPE